MNTYYLISLVLIHYGSCSGPFDWDRIDVDDFEISTEDLARDSKKSTYDYGFVIDAGSTGTRIYGFKWEPRVVQLKIDDSDDDDEPIQRIYEAPKSKPQQVGDSFKYPVPLASATTIEAVADILDVLIQNATDILEDAGIDHNLWKNFPLYLKATAGVRMLDRQQREELFKNTRSVLSNQYDPGFNPFKYEDSYVFIASGSEEALYDWLSVNYLMITLDEEHNTNYKYGALDMGGASTQIAFAPDNQKSFDIIDDYMYADPLGEPWRVFATSHLGYGKNEMERQIAAIVYVNDDNNNPCLVEGTSVTYDFIRVDYERVEDVTQIGAPDMDKCVEYLQQILYMDEHQCLFDETANGAGECSINGQYLPQIPDDMYWYGLDNFGKKISQTSEIVDSITETSSLQEIYDAAETICGMTIDEITAVVGENNEPTKLCIMDLYTVVLLRDAYGFDMDKHNIYWAEEIDGLDAGWQWGSILYDVNLLPAVIEIEEDDDDKNM